MYKVKRKKQKVKRKAGMTPGENSL